MQVNVVDSTTDTGCGCGQGNAGGLNPAEKAHQVFSIAVLQGLQFFGQFHDHWSCLELLYGH